MIHSELFLDAYDVINNKSNWGVITALADYIMATGEKIIECEEAIAILDARSGCHNNVMNKDYIVILR